MATPTPTTTSHARKSAVGLRVGHRDGKRRVSKLPRLGIRGPREAPKACHRKLGPLGQDLAPLTATTLRAIHVGQESDQQANQTSCWSH